jgi:hypothetical protein
MLLILIGALLVLAGIVVLAAPPPIWLARLSGGRPQPTTARATFEPPRPAARFNLAGKWPGLALMALGGILLLAAAVS